MSIDLFLTVSLIYFLFNLGDAMKPEHWIKFITLLSSFNVRLFVQYGMSECPGALGYHLLNVNDTVVPMGYPLLDVQCLLVNEQGQVINHSENSNEIGQMHIRGKHPLFA